MPWMAVEKDYAFEGPDGPAEPARPVRGAPPADRLPRSSSSRASHGWPEQRLPRLLVRRRPGRAPRAPQRPRHDARVRLARAAGRHRALEGADGLETSPGTRSPTTSTPTSASTSGTAPTSSSATATADLPHLLHQQPRRRGDGQHLELPRHHRARPPGGVGGLAGGLSADRRRTSGGTGTTSTSSATVIRSRPLGRRGVPAGRARQLTVFAHVGGVPLEEFLPAAPAVVAGLLVVRAWVVVRVRRNRQTLR